MQKIFNLEPFSFATLASLSWEASLKTTRIEFELPTDVNMILFCINGIGGRITRVIRHYAEANNKYMSNYDKTKKIHALSIIRKV